LRQIEETNIAIEALNQDLERQVEQKTSVNLELSKTLASQEKFALLGEIASGIAHDLNTPLSAIKVGGENIRYSLERLFKEVILKCSAEQVSFACERAMKGHVVSNMRGSQQRMEVARISEFLVSDFAMDADRARTFASLIWRAALDISDRDTIEKVMYSENPELFLDLISLLQTLRVFTETIMSSSDRAAKVVMNLRQFIRGSNVNHLDRVNLRSSIETVLNIFNHELKYKVNLSIDLPESIFIHGYENRLFQLWSNLIKNALEALESANTPQRMVWIRVETNNSSTSVIFGNNGPQIPEKLRERIFDKFFTTKHEHGGTGLGLSIVKGIIEDHRAEILVRSTEEQTEFEVVFNH
jgi:signal transduction histidine kinase